MTSLVEKILAVHAALDAAGVRHAVGGAIALGYHVESPRATVDIDLNITAPTRQARTVLGALPGAVTWDDADLRQISRTGQVRLWWDETPVDLFFPQHELHAVIADRAVTVPFAGHDLPVVGATDLTILKALFDRPKDWVDLGAMLDYGEVDVAEARSWLVRLMGVDDLRVARFDELVQAQR